MSGNNLNLRGKFIHEGRVLQFSIMAQGGAATETKTVSIIVNLH